jgi:phosphate-selective porin OprO/OprP
MWIRWSLLALGVIVFGAPVSALAQSSSPPAAANPSPVAGAAREAQLEERVRQLESQINKLSTQVNQVPAPPSDPATRGGPDPRGRATPDTGTPATTVAPSRTGGAGAPGQSLPPNPPPSLRVNMPAPVQNIRSNVKFGPGFEISTTDDEYQFQFHNLTQADYRGYQQGGQSPVHDTFDVARQWFIFTGRLTKPLEYFVSFHSNFNNFSLLWSWLNIHYDDRLQFKIGRIFTPFTYELYQVPTAFLLSPERSLFGNNFNVNTDVGMMAWGQLLKKRVDYAVGIFNGTRANFVDFNDSKDLQAYLNVRPFLEAGIPFLQYLNIGGSVLTGNEFQVPVPSILRTNVNLGADTSGTAGPQFLAFNSNVRESGWRALWDLHAAYYYKHLSLIGEWGSGFQDYAFVNSPAARTHVPINGYYVTAGYFLTGENVTARNIVKPNRDFDIRKSKRGPGAIEPTVRYSHLNIGREVFTAGLADPNNWTNQLYSIDLGVNWYLTQYVKVYLGWEHDVYGNPVVFAPGRRNSTTDQAWVRFQIFF